MKSNKIKPLDKSYVVWYDGLDKAHYGQYLELYDSFTDYSNDCVLKPREEITKWKYQ